MAVIRATGLVKKYQDLEVVAGVSLQIEKGECFGLLGPNGAGKTTTLRLLLGLTEPHAGEIDVLGFRVPHEARVARQRIGVVSQFDNLDPDFSVRENLIVYGRYFQLPQSVVAERIPKLLAFANLSHRENARIQTLSGGMKRRLTLARALINDPDLIFLDEPTTGLDPQARHTMWAGLRELLNTGKTIVLTTHFMDEAERLCDRVSIMDQGRIITTGAPQNLIKEHIEPQVTEVYGENLDNWARTQGQQLCERWEITGETLFCYGQDGNAAIAQLRGENELRYVHRQANLEDVFLKLTGRELRD